MKYKQIALLLGLPLLAACGQFHWTNPADPNANFNTDLDFCTQQFDQNNARGNQGSGINQSPNVPLNPVQSSGVINDQYIPPVNTGCEGGAGLFGCSTGYYPSNTHTIDNCLMSKGWRMRRN